MLAIVTELELLPQKHQWVSLPWLITMGRGSLDCYESVRVPYSELSDVSRTLVINMHHWGANS